MIASGLEHRTTQFVNERSTISKMNTQQISQKDGKKKDLHVGVFCQTLGITAYTSENYSDFKSKFSFNNRSILEIHDYFWTR